MYKRQEELNSSVGLEKMPEMSWLEAGILDPLLMERIQDLDSLVTGHASLTGGTFESEDDVRPNNILVLTRRKIVPFKIPTLQLAPLTPYVFFSNIICIREYWRMRYEN